MFDPIKVGENKIDQMSPEICNILKSKRYTNHSWRGTGIRLLKRAGFSDRDITKVSGHKALQSLDNYDTELDHSKKLRMANALQLLNTTESVHSKSVETGIESKLPQIPETLNKSPMATAMSSFVYSTPGMSGQMKPYQPSPELTLLYWQQELQAKQHDTIDFMFRKYVEQVEKQA